MAIISKFYDLEVWKESHKLTLLVYKHTKDFPLRRAVVSVESCIAEGFSRYHYKDRLTFYYDSRGSIAEIQTQVLMSKDLGYLLESEFQEIFNQSEKTAVILGGLIRSTENLSKLRSKIS